MCIRVHTCGVVGKKRLKRVQRRINTYIAGHVKKNYNLSIKILKVALVLALHAEAFISETQY